MYIRFNQKENKANNHYNNLKSKTKRIWQSN
jgi:hypothetical protein